MLQGWYGSSITDQNFQMQGRPKFSSMHDWAFAVSVLI
jgi:hypothetical protein